MTPYLFLLAGLALLFFSGDYLVKGSISLASHFRVSKLVIGVVIVSLGTSAPELVVSIEAALKNHPDIALGNVLGSNVSNIALILGLTAVVLPVRVMKRSILLDWSVMMLASLTLYIFILNGLLEFHEGLIMLSILAVYIYISIHLSRRENKKINATPVKPGFSLIVSLVMVVGASLGLVFGANLLVRGAASIAREFGVSERAISISLVAFGTSVPELATSIMAAVRKEVDIFIGNIIGSNIFNILAILGVTSAIKKISVHPTIVGFDIFWMLGVSFLLLLFMLPLKTGVITRWKGFTFLAIYSFYIYLVFMTN